MQNPQCDFMNAAREKLKKLILPIAKKCDLKAVCLSASPARSNASPNRKYDFYVQHSKMRRILINI